MTGGKLERHGARTPWGWIGRNWEPIVALLALAASIWSTWAAKAGVDLAYEGIRIASEAQALARRDFELRNLPLLSMGPSAPPTFGMQVQNDGLGPGPIYKLEIRSGEHTLALDDQMPPQHSMTLTSNFLYRTTIDAGINPTVRWDWASPFMFMGAGQSNYFVTYTGNDLDLDKDSAYQKWHASMRISGCFTDLSQENSWSFGSADIDCTISR